MVGEGAGKGRELEGEVDGDAGNGGSFWGPGGVVAAEGEEGAVGGLGLVVSGAVEVLEEDAADGSVGVSVVCLDRGWGCA